MPTATKTKQPDQARQFQVTADRASWPTIDDFAPYRKAAGRLAELTQQEADAQADVSRLTAKHDQLRASAVPDTSLTADELSQQAQALTSEPPDTTPAARRRAPPPRPESLVKAHEELTAARQKLAIVGRAVQLQREIVDRQAAAAATWIRGLLDSQQRRLVDRVLGLLGHLYDAVEECQEMDAWTERQGFRFRAIRSLCDKSLLSGLARFEWSLAGHYVPHDGEEAFAEAKKLQAEAPDLHTELVAIENRYRLESQQAGNQNEPTRVLAIQARREEESQAAKRRVQQAYEKIGRLEAEGKAAAGDALAAYRENCAQRVTLDP